jgi:Sec-independent protein translocase protein TatA
LVELETRVRGIWDIVERIKIVVVVVLIVLGSERKLVERTVMQSMVLLRSKTRDDTLEVVPVEDTGRW